MSVIIRLQNLPWSANAFDIREFFKGLSIPDGGVHIVGGEMGDAFIAFSTDEDARLAMQRSATSLKGIQVKLLLSSRSEMQKVIEAAHQQAMALQGFMSPAIIPTQPQAPPTSAPVAQPPPVMAPTPVPAPPHLSNMMPHHLGAHTPYPAHFHPARQDLKQPNLPMGMHQPHMMSPGMPQQAPSMSLPPPSMPQHPVVAPVSLGMTPPTSQAAPNHVGLPPSIPQTPPQQVAVPSPSSQGPLAQPGLLLPSSQASMAQAGLPPPSSQGVPQLQNGSPPTTIITLLDNGQPSTTTSNSSEKKEDKKDEKKDEKKSSSSSSSRRDSKGRDSRRRRSKSRSRSRSRSRERRRRHRSRTRSRSRDRSSRSSRRRSRSRDRDRGRDRRDRDRDRDRDKDRDRSSRSGRDRIDRHSQDGEEGRQQEAPKLGGEGGIPGLGEIPSGTVRGLLPSTLTEPIKNSPIQTPSGSPGLGHPILGGPPGLKTPVNPAPLTVTLNDPMDTESGDDTNPGSIELPGASRFGPKEGMKGPGDGGPVRKVPKGLLGDGPVGVDPQQLVGFNNQGGSFRNFGQDVNFDPREQMDRHQNDRDPREAHGFRGDMDRNDFRGQRDIQGQPVGGWEPRSKQDSRGERPSRFDRPEGGKDAEWNGWGKRDDKWAGSRDKPEHWKDIYSHQGEPDENYDNYGFQGFRGRGGPPRGRGGGHGFGQRYHGGYQDGFGEDGADEGYSFRGGYRGRGGFRGRGGGPPGYREKSEWDSEETCSVEILRLPYSVSYRAIRELFRGIYVPKTGIKILTDEQGNRNGCAVLQFNCPWDAQRACRCSGNFVFGNKAEVNLISDEKYEMATDFNQVRSMGRVRPIPWHESPCMCLANLPPNFMEEDVGQMLTQFKMLDLIMEQDGGSRFTGRCFIRLGTPEEAQLAVKNLTGITINSNLITAEICPPEALANAARNRDFAMGNSTGIPSAHQEPHINVQEKITDRKPKQDMNGMETQKHQEFPKADLLTDSVVMKNLPKDTTEANIRDFFSDEGLVPERVHFFSPDGTEDRQVYVMFPQIEDTLRATGKSQQQLGKMKVEVELVAKPLVMAAMGIQFDPLELIRKGQKTGSTKGDQNLENTENQKLNIEASNQAVELGAGPHGGGMGQEDLHQGADVYPAGGIGEMGQGMRPGFSGSQANFGGARPWGMNQMSGFGPMGGPRGPVDQDMPRMRGPGPLLRDPGMDTPPQSGAETLGTAIPPEHFGKPGCVVAMSNVPYRANTDDILQFFCDFPNLQPENIIRRYNEFNQPTADARICLNSPEEAKQAITTLNRKTINGRNVFLTLVTD